MTEENERIKPEAIIYLDGYLPDAIFVFACKKHTVYLKKSHITLKNVKELNPVYRKSCFFNRCEQSVSSYGMLNNNYIRKTEKWWKHGR